MNIEAISYLIWYFILMFLYDYLMRNRHLKYINFYFFFFYTLVYIIFSTICICNR